MPRIQLTDLNVDETLDAQALQQVRGGIIAILIGRQAAGDGSVVPTDQFSLNFTSKVQKVMPTDQLGLNFSKKW